MKKLFVLCFIIFLIISGYAYYIFNYRKVIVEDTLYIEKNSSFQKVIHDVFPNISMVDEFLITRYALFKGYDKTMLPGSYDLSGNSRVISIFNDIQKGPSIDEIEVTFIEGWTNEQYIQTVNALFNNTQDFSDIINNPPSQDLIDSFPFLKDAKSLQGYLFPDTYRFYENSDSLAIINRLLKTFETKVGNNGFKELYDRGYTVDDVVTLASIVEKEVRQPETKRIVADIFWKRLEINMPLQSDATINYVTKAGNDRPTYDELEVDSLYNTYKYTGLPPSPISNPGFHSLYATIYPLENEYYYFLTNSKGEIYYGRTFDEHVQNRRYLD